MNAKQSAIRLIIVLLLFLPTPAEAHSGPPFIVVPEQAVGPYTATVWADPDVGSGTFIIEATANGVAPPDGTSVTVAVRPLDGHLPEVSAPASRQSINDGSIFQNTMPLDAEGQWAVRVTLDGPAGHGEVPFEITATPAWSGWVTNLLCFLPFIALGGLWVYGLRRQRQLAEVEGGTIAHHMWTDEQEDVERPSGLKAISKRDTTSVVSLKVSRYDKLW